MIPELMVQPSYWIDSDIWISRFDIAILFELCLKSLIKREHRNSPPEPPVHGVLGRAVSFSPKNLCDLTPQPLSLLGKGE